jgi:chromosome segregation protein
VRLKSLEIKGFKSFADKTVLNFDEGITGVIGPNGCGKSNIIDSIRWVIGEHKISNLRSENLESLVFNGSKSRSASGLAEVSLTFENTKNLLPTEFNTVTVTRKYYKNGESEYRLNDVACRLKDITNLFMDTGVSTDSYAIIELGMVDDIIKDKDNSRRKMLEQAAGITIYKTRKKEARLKLDATEQDLARIEDLLFEINNQLKTLENQAKKAEKYFEIKKDYKESSIELAKAALEGFNDTYRTLNEQQQEEVDKRIALEASIAGEEAALEKEKLEFVEKERALQEMQQAFNELLNTLRSTEGDKNLTAQRLQYLREKQGDLHEFLKKAELQLKGLDESIAFTGTQIGDDEQKAINLQSNLDGLQKIVEEKRKLFDDRRAGLDELRREAQTVQRTQFELEKSVAVADTGIGNLQMAITRIEEEQVRRKAQLEEAGGQLREKEQLLETRKTELQQLQEQHEQTKEKIFAAQHQLEELRSHLAEESRKLDSRKNEHALLKSLIESMEGYPESVKFLHKNPEWKPDAPLLSDVIYVQPDYRAALETVLEPYLNYYVVDNLSEGLAAVQLLDRSKKGKANFFLLDRFTEESVPEQPSGTIPAMGLVEVDVRYASLARHLLGHVFVAESDTALESANGATVIEKSGKFVKGKYSLSGGSVGVFEGKKIGRVKNLEKLQEEIAAQDKVVAELKAAIQQRHNEVIGYNEQLRENAIQQTQQEINQLSSQLYALQHKTENLGQQSSSAENTLVEYRSQLEQSRQAISGSREELVRCNQQQQELETRVNAVETDYTLAEQAYTAAGNEYNKANIELTRQQSKVASLKQELEFKTNQLNELKLRMDSSNSQLGELASEMDQTSARLGTLESQLAEMLRNKDAEERRLNEADQAYYNLRNELARKETELRQKQKSKEGIDTRLNEIKDKLTELKLQLAGMKERLQVEFRVDLEAIIDEPRTTDTPLEELQEKNDRMRKRLENIGEINPTAVEAYTEMKKRYDFIVEQKNDLVTAKDSLMQTIQEVEATANQQFLDTFNKVRENFQKVFQALFTEDDIADMVLVDPDNLAETGIDIVAKPKGKRPSSIGQLSGGEKTLTATALLFAIYLIKPAPFCILDEVDAPLDDANVGKFTKMIQQFSENSQFIIVTHNKQTMSAVDVIYGVTMQEAGVSKLVPVDFRSLN